MKPFQSRSCEVLLRQTVHQGFLDALPELPLPASEKRLPVFEQIKILIKPHPDPQK